MKAPDTWPQRIKKGNAVVTIYRYKNKDYAEFKLAYNDATGKRRLQTFSKYADAVERANEVAATVNRGESQTLTLTSGDRIAYVRATEALKPFGIPLDIAAHQLAAALERLKGRSITEAVEFYLKKHPRELPSKTVEQAVSEFVAFTSKNGASEVYLKDLNFRLGKFAEAFRCQLASVTATEINGFLRSLDCAPRGRSNYKAAIRTMFRFASREKWLPKDHIDWQDVDRVKTGATDIEIFTPSEMMKLLDAARLNPDDLEPGFNRRYASGQGLLPLLVLGGFAGLRAAEIQRQLWTDIDLESGFIRVTAAKGNTAQKRLVPIAANLKAWLKLCRRDFGTCCDYPRPNEAIVRLSRRAAVKWKHNALRHSFISYRVAETQDVPKVSLEAGNSPRMVFNNYRQLVTPAQAKAWFSILP